MAPLKRSPRTDAALDSELLRGEAFRVFEETAEGWSWGQLETDAYVGYVPTEALGPPVPEPTHRVAVLRTFVYPGPDMKLPALGALSLGCRLAIAGEGETRGTLYPHLAGGEGAVIAAHVAQREAPPERISSPSPSASSRRLIYGAGAPASVSIARPWSRCLWPPAAIPRPATPTCRRRCSPAIRSKAAMSVISCAAISFLARPCRHPDRRRRMLHASGHHMTVVVERLTDAIGRIARTAGAPTSVLRLAADA